MTLTMTITITALEEIDIMSMTLVVNNRSCYYDFFASIQDSDQFRSLDCLVNIDKRKN